MTPEELENDDAENTSGEDDIEIEVLDEPEIEIVDVTPEEDKGRPKRQEGDDPDIPEDDDIKKYGKRAQDRIKELRYEFHTERRTREEASRQRDEAITFARKQMEENARMRAALQHGEKQLVTQSEHGAKSLMAAAEAEYRKAYEDGDAEKMLDAQKKIAQAQVSLNAVANYRPQYQQPAQPNPQPQVQPQPQQQPPQAQPVQPQTSSKTADWLSQNRWYGKDPEMTRFAQGVDERLRFQDGIDPRVDEDGYWSKVDDAMRNKFPERFAARGEKPRKSVVAPASRAPVARTKKVTLTTDEVAVARRLGVSNEQYAREKRRLAEKDEA